MFLSRKAEISPKDEEFYLTCHLGNLPPGRLPLFWQPATLDQFRGIGSKITDQRRDQDTKGQDASLN